MVVIAMASWAAWLWLLYGQRHALWLRREYIDDALVVVVLVGVVLSFVRARRGNSIARAWAETAATVVGCAGVVATAYAASLGLAYAVGRFAP
jgi:hypothetical protein